MKVLPENILRRMDPKARQSLGKAGKTAAECSEAQAVKSERDLQNLIANWLLLNGIYFVRQRMDRKAGLKVGTPDFLICFEGKFVGIEVKIGREKPSQEQEIEMDRIEKSGGYTFVIRSLEDLKGVLRG